MKRKLWLRLAAVGIMTLIFIWNLIPPFHLLKDGFQWSDMLDVLRPGIDLAGGTRLVYQVEKWTGAPGTTPAEDLIKVLKGRIDPNGVKNLIWRPVGNDRIEIIIPKATASSSQGAKLYQECRDRLLEADIRPSDLKKAQAEPTPEVRKAVFLGLVRGVTEREGLLKELADAWEAVRAAEKGAGAASRPELDPKVLEARMRYDAALRKATDTNVRWLDVNQVLRMDKKTREKATGPGGKSPLALLKARYPTRFDTQIAPLIAASDNWKLEKQALDDPNDLKRLLQGTGVLEFHIAVLPEELPDRGQSLIAGLQKSLDVPGGRYGWFQAADPEVAAKGGVVTGERLGTPYVLVYMTPEKSMKHTAEGDWKFESASAKTDSYGSPEVAFSFDEIGGIKFARLTGNNLKKPLTAIMDGKVISIATIQSQIRTDGVITGTFSIEEVRELAQKLQAGALPGSLSKEPISEARVDAQLGASQRQAGLRATGIALIAVCSFMLIYYLVPLGLVADIAVLFNLLYLLGTMAIGHWTFTMPGIAGLILTVGIAVDANVLIDERIREEQAKGLPLRTALKNGYSRAFTVIIDSHVTALMTTAILWVVGTTEIKGFATTLFIGLVYSLFTSVFLTRWLLQLAVEYGWVKGHMPMLKLIGVPKVRWMDKRFFFWCVSAAMLVGGLGFFFTRPSAALYDVEFIGGTKAQVTLAPGVNADEEQIGTLLRDRNKDDLLFKAVAVHKIELSGEAAKRGETFEIVVPASLSGEDLYDAARVAAVSAGISADDISKAQVRAKDAATQAERQQIFLGLVGDKEARRPAVVKLADAFEKMLEAQKETAKFRAGIIAAMAEPQNVAGLGTASLLLPSRAELNFTDRAAWAPVAKDVRERLPLPGELPTDAFAITDAQMPQGGDANLEDFKGGIGMVISGISPAATLEELRSRVKAQLNSTEYQALPTALMSSGEAETTAGWDFFGLAPAGQSPEGAPLFGKVLYAARSEQYVYDPANPVKAAEWKDKLALPEVAAVHDALSLPQELNSLTYFSPSVAGDLVIKAWTAILLSMVAIMVYIWVRFGNWKFGLGVIIPIFHDAGVVIGMVALAKLIAGTAIGHALLIADFRFDLTVVAAVLTVIGYSTNDTIVVFDRIRENRGRLSYVTSQLIDASINQTMSRTLLTSMTVFIVVLIMYVLGGEAIRAFNWAMLIGIIVGTYSSIVIASPILLGWRTMTHRRAASGQPAPEET